MARKIPIDTTGRFYELKNKDECCVVCAQHQFVVVQKFTSFYAMHTYLAVPSSTAFCLHAWRTREEDPPCLKAFAPTDKSVTTHTNFKSLSQALQAQAQGLQREQVARLRAEANAMRGGVRPVARMNARRFRNPFGD